MKLRQTDVRFYGTKALVIVRHGLSGGGFMVRMQIRCRATIVVSEVCDAARIIQVAWILLRGRSAVISTSDLMTQARQQVLWGRVDRQVAKISDHHWITAWQPRLYLWRETERQNYLLVG